MCGEWWLGVCQGEDPLVRFELLLQSVAPCGFNAPATHPATHAGAAFAAILAVILALAAGSQAVFGDGIGPNVLSSFQVAQIRCDSGGGGGGGGGASVLAGGAKSNRQCSSTGRASPLHACSLTSQEAAATPLAHRCCTTGRPPGLLAGLAGSFPPPGRPLLPQHCTALRANASRLHAGRCGYWTHACASCAPLWHYTIAGAAAAGEPVVAAAPAGVAPAATPGGHRAARLAPPCSDVCPSRSSLRPGNSGALAAERAIAYHAYLPLTEAMPAAVALPCCR